MQLFNRTPTTASITCEFNSNVYNGDTRGVKGRFSLTIPHCLFVAFCTKNGLSDYSKGIILQIFTDTQLSSSDRSFTLMYENEDLTTTSLNLELDETFVDGFTNDMSGTICRVALKNDDITKANATAAEKPLYMYTATMINRLCGYSSGYDTIPDQTDFKLLAESVPCICFEATYTYPSGVFNNLCHGHYLTRTDGTGRLNIADYYYTEDCYTSWMSAPNYGNNDYNNYCRAQMFWLWVVANGNIDTDFDITDPFQPFPSDFYITVNANSDHEQKGEQSVTFTWTANNSDDTDLSNVDLHFEFSQGSEHVYEMSCGYADESLAVTYRDIVGKLDLPWWKNIIQKLPIVGQHLTNSTIMVNIWWNDLTGDAGKCQYLMEYDGRNNSVSIDKAKDPVTEYWTYLTAENEDIGQTPEEPENPYDGFDFGGGTDSVNGSALLTTSYSLSVSGAHDFGRWLWGTGFDLEQLKMVVNNPIENVVSCKLFPFSITGTASTVKIGNLTSSVSAYYLPENVARTFDFGTIKLDKTNFKLFGNFLDYAPFTTITIYLPYLGFHELDTDLAMGANIGVKYYVDFVTGACRAIVTATKYSEVLRQNVTKVLQAFDGNIGQDVPITASNRAQVEAGYIVGGAQAIANFASGIGAIATGNVGGGLSAIGNGITGGIQTAMQMYHSYTNGTPSPALSRFDEQRPYLILDSPVYTEPKGFAHQNGHMCNLTYKLANLHGYTVVDNTVDLSSIPCNFEEREKILELLTSGVYL